MPAQALEAQRDDLLELRQDAAQRGRLPLVARRRGRGERGAPPAPAASLRILKGMRSASGVRSHASSGGIALPQLGADRSSPEAAASASARAISSSVMSRSAR